MFEGLERILSRPAAKPYRNRALSRDAVPYLNKDGHVDFEPNDIENPKNWAAWRRWYIVVVAVLLVVNATFASSSPSGVVMGISDEFHVSNEAAGLVTTLFLLGYCFGPLFWAPLSEYYGRRFIFYITFLSYIAFNFLCAFAPNFASLLIGRFLTGTFVSAPLSNAPGVLADLMNPIERGNAMALFSCMTFAGPALGPVLGGLMELKEDWRWDFYILLMLSGITLIGMFTIPETLASRVLTNKARRIRKLQIPGYEHVQSPTEAMGRSLGQIFKIALTRPWIILFDPISFLCAIYMSVVYCLLYMLFSIVPIIFQEKRRWNPFIGELPLLSSVVGAAAGAALVFLFSRRDAKRLQQGIRAQPEDRMIVAMIGGVGFAVFMFWFGWSGEYNSVPWIVPVLGLGFLSSSILLIFVAFLNYLTDTYLMYAASAMAANTVARSAAGAAAPLFTNQMFSKLGVGGGGSLIGGVATLLACIPFLFYKYGHKIRVKSKFAPTDQPTDHKPKDEESKGADEDTEPSSNVEDADNLSDASSVSSLGDHGQSIEKKETKDVHQNALGEPRVANTTFGHEDKEINV